RGAGRDVFEAEYAQAKASRAATASESERVASQLLLDVLTAYWELFYAGRSVEIQRRSLELARARLQDAVDRVQTGSLAPVEELAYRTKVASIEEDLATALADERKRSNELARLAGESPLRTQHADLTRPPPAPVVPPADARERMLAVSFELAEERANV